MKARTFAAGAFARWQGIATAGGAGPTQSLLLAARGRPATFGPRQISISAPTG